MHPHISEMVNKLFYNGKLVDNACTVGRDDAKLFSRWIRSIGYEGSRQSIFCEIARLEFYLHRSRWTFETESSIPDCCSRFGGTYADL